MGAINYKISDYITLGYNCNNIDYQDEYYFDIINFYYDEIAGILRNEFFYYFNVKLAPGYYEGFSLDIDCNFSYCFDNWKEKAEAQKEITEIKNFLLKCINEYECCAVAPGWCTTYFSHDDTIKKLNDAIKEMRDHVASVPTWRQVQKEC